MRFIFIIIFLTLFSCSSDEQEVTPLLNEGTQKDGNLADFSGREMDMGNAQPDIRDEEDMGNDSDIPIRPKAPEVDPNCTDGKYIETLPTPMVDISPELNSFSTQNLEAFYAGVLTKRFPVGKWVVEKGLTNDRFDCVGVFSGNPQNADEAIGRMSTVVHECGHIYNFTLDKDGYGITPDLTITCEGGDTTERRGETFARSRLRGDDYNDRRPGCDVSGGSCDFYAQVYLDGDPDDANFEGGDQGFNSVLEETLQYVNSIAVSYAFQDFIPGSTSAMDGILTFLWYVERYLRLARLEYPRAYSKLADDPCWRNAILTIWGRAWIMLEAAEGNGSLGINDVELFELVRDPDLLDEIQRLREKEGCAN